MNTEAKITLLQLYSLAALVQVFVRHADRDVKIDIIPDGGLFATERLIRIEIDDLPNGNGLSIGSDGTSFGGPNLDCRCERAGNSSDEDHLKEIAQVMTNIMTGRPPYWEG